MSRTATIRQLLIIQRLQQGPLGFEELNRFLLDKSEAYELELAIDKRTFHRDKRDIALIHQIHIEFSPKLKTYSIADTGEAQDRLIDALQLLALTTGDNLSQYVQLETRRALGREYFQPLLLAIKNRKVVSMVYHKFSDIEPEPRLVEPLALKESQGRWYLVAVNEGHVKTYGLDRIIEMEITQKGFKYPKDWSVERYFENAFGVINDQDGPQEVLLSFTWEQGNYVKAYPLHHSQKIVLETADEVQVSLYLSISFDFIKEVLSHMHTVEVLAPPTLRDEVQKALTKTLKYYVPTPANIG